MLFEAYDVLVNIVNPNIVIGSNIRTLFKNTLLFSTFIIIPPFLFEQLINYNILRIPCQILVLQSWCHFLYILLYNRILSKHLLIIYYIFIFYFDFIYFYVILKSKE